MEEARPGPGWSSSFRQVWCRWFAWCPTRRTMPERMGQKMLMDCQDHRSFVVIYTYTYTYTYTYIYIYIVSVKHAVLHGRNPHTVFVRIQPIFAPKFPRWMAKATIRNLTYHISKDLGGGSKSKGLTSFLALAWGSQVPCGLVSQAQQCLKMAWPHAAA